MMREANKKQKKRNLLAAVEQSAYFHRFIFSCSSQLLPLLYSNSKKPKSPRIKIIDGLVSSSHWNEVCAEELQLLAGFPYEPVSGSCI